LEHILEDEHKLPQLEMRMKKNCYVERLKDVERSSVRETDRDRKMRER